MHCAQPFGAKPNDTIRISDMYGVPIRLSYGVGQAAPPTKPPPPAGKLAVALPVSAPVLLPWTKATTAAVSPAAPP